MSTKLITGILLFLLTAQALTIVMFDRKLHPTENSFLQPDVPEFDYDEALLPCSPDTRPSIDNLDYYDWIYCSFDLRPLWSELRIDGTGYEDSSSLAEAWNVYGDLDGDGRDERVLRLTLSSDDKHKIVFVVLRRTLFGSRARWRPLAHLEMPDFHLAPEARVASNGRTQWLAIRNDEKVWAAGRIQENETWYALAGRRLVPVLSFPAMVDEVRTLPVQFHRETQLETGRVLFEEGKDTVQLSATAKFTWDATDTEGVTLQTRIQFSRDLSAQQFRFNESHSDIPETAYRAIFDLTFSPGMPNVGDRRAQE